MSDFFEENKNFLKLEKKLLEIDRISLISNDAEIAKAVKSIIEEELNKPEKQRDYGLIDEAIKVILPIINPEFAKLMESINKCSDYVAERIKEINTEDQ